ncbi:MAG: helix-turn-helix transcriptional regulator [Pseudomonadota bacterium]
MLNPRTGWVTVGRFKIQSLKCMREKPLGLSRREIDTLWHLAMGRSTTESAEVMGVSKSTIETYKQRMYEKLCVSSAPEAAVIATAISCGAIVADAHDSGEVADVA